MPFSMLESINQIRRSGAITPKPTTLKNVKYTTEFKQRALILVEELGGRNKAAKALGISPSLITTFSTQQSEGRF